MPNVQNLQFTRSIYIFTAQLRCLQNVLVIIIIIIIKNVHSYSDTMAKMLQGHFKMSIWSSEIIVPSPVNGHRRHLFSGCPYIHDHYA